MNVRQPSRRHATDTHPCQLLNLPIFLLNDSSSGARTVGLLGCEVLLINHAIIDIGGQQLFLHPY